MEINHENEYGEAKCSDEEIKCSDEETKCSDEEMKYSNEEAKCSNEQENEFYFESDHVALKGNKDYNTFLKTIITLQAQRTQAIEDLDTLMITRAKAVKDPILFVAQLQNGNFPELPGPQKVIELPYIDWSQYNVTMPDIQIRPQTRYGHIPQMQLKNEQESGKILVRGRAFDDSKPETFNQLWTMEEQKRLEELLKIYPQEEVEMRRWTKIANALGNRTPKQVSSRVQKYFIKLLKAGLPIPGKGPKIKLDVKKGLNHRHHRNNNLLFKRSTFFPHQDISYSIESEENKEQIVTEKLIDDTTNKINDDNPELRQINLLRQIKIEKEQNYSSIYEHVGYKCTICDEEPLKGTRWHCAECSEVDLCSDCVVTQLESKTPIHNAFHKLIPMRLSQSRNYDSDYYPQNFNTSYNYLDPNFLPE